MIKKIGKILFFMFFLSNCGFSPMYKAQNDQSIVIKTQEINILPIANRQGFVLYELLENKLNPYKKKDFQYTLSASLTKKENKNIILQSNDLSSREGIVMKAEYTLKDKNGKVLLKAKDEVSGRYNVLKEGYATYMTAEKLENDLLNMLADKMSLRLMSYFKQEAVRAS